MIYNSTDRPIEHEISRVISNNFVALEEKSNRLFQFNKSKQICCELDMNCWTAYLTHNLRLFQNLRESFISLSCSYRKWKRVPTFCAQVREAFVRSSFRDIQVAFLNIPWSTWHAYANLFKNCDGATYFINYLIHPLYLPLGKV